MNRSPLLAALMLLVLPGCSSDSLPPIDQPQPPPVVIPTPSPYGLDERPSNPTCLARERPAENTGIATLKVFPKLAFAQPVLALQAPADSSRVFVVLRGGIV